MKTTTAPTTSTRKVRRSALGGKRADGHALQGLRRRRRPDPRAMRVAADEPTVTSVAGLVGFGAFLRELGVDAALRTAFDALKPGPRAVYPMHAQLRLLLDALAAGETRVFGLERLAADPLFVWLAGGAVPSLDVLYDDLGRFDAAALARLDALVAAHGLAPVRALRRPTVVHLDVDTTVAPLFGAHIEGALPGPNPRYRGRPSYHPLLARVAETDTLVGAQLRPGDTNFGDADVPTIVAWVRRVRAAVGPRCTIRVRVDAAGDCTALLAALAREPNVTFVVKARMTPDLCGAIAAHARWTSVEPVAGQRPTLQTAEIRFQRAPWTAHRCAVRTVAVRSRERECGKQIYLWEGLDWTVQAFLTNDGALAAEDVAPTYNGRAGIEPLIAELKNGVGLGAVPTQSFHANHAMLLLKLLAFNLLRRYVAARFAPIRAWRTPWVRRAIILQPGRVVRSARRRTLRVHPASMLARKRE